ncbi:MAG: MFS transporter [Firmicutes bacterium]|nr:MFS transporter [Bacillota bacterium]
MEDKKYLTRKNYITFPLAGMGLNFMGSFVNTVILIFYTEILLAPYKEIIPIFVVISVITVCVNLFDAVNDPFMGMIIDRTRTRFGKIRTFLLITIIPISLMTVVLFLAPANASLGAILAFIVITYFVQSTVYSFCDVPMAGMSAAITPNPDERVTFITVVRIIGPIGAALPLVAITIYQWIVKIPPATDPYWAETGLSWATAITQRNIILAIVAGVVGGALYSLAFFGNRERVDVLKQAPPKFKENFKIIAENKPALLFLFSNILGALRPLAAFMAGYVALGMFGNDADLVWLNALWAFPGFAFVFFNPKIYKKMGGKKMYLTLTFAGASLCIIFGIIGIAGGLAVFGSFAFLMIYMLFTGIPFSMVSNINGVLLAETVDYMEWKTGKRTDAVTMSLSTSLMKFTGAIQMGIALLALQVIRWVPVGSLNYAGQSKATLTGLFVIISIVPALAWILSAIPMFFYKFYGAERERIYKELSERRAEIAKNEEDAVKTTEVAPQEALAESATHNES